MTPPLYDIYFTGQLVEGTSQEIAQKNLAQLFKTNIDTVAKLFNGNPQVLKRGIDKTGALKYKAALHKAGVLVAFKAHQPETLTSAENKPDANEKNIAKNISTQTPLSIAALGSDVLNDNEKKVIETRDIDTHAIKLMSVFAEPQSREKEPPETPDTSHLSMAKIGENLLESTPVLAPPLELDLDAISVAPVGADLEQLRDNTPTLTPNIIGISIAPVGSNLAPNNRGKKPPLAPNTDHFSLSEN